METKSLRQVLEDHGEAMIRTAGISMEPLLHAQESTVLIKKKDGPCRKNDVALFIRRDGRYVLHRVLRTGNKLLLQGDAQLTGEWIDEECVIGVMVGFHARRNSKFCPIQSGAYRVYIFCLPVFRLYLRIRALFGRRRRKGR